MWILVVVLASLSAPGAPQGRTYFDKDGNYIPPDSSDVDYKTYTYGNRRYGNPLYGQAQPGYQVPPSSYPGIPNVPNFPPNQYNPGYNPNYYDPAAYNPGFGNPEVHRGLPRPDDPRFDVSNITRSNNSNNH